jgi:TRAP-type C4-dicarboxylate transport system permease small subunit
MVRGFITMAKKLSHGGALIASFLIIVLVALIMTEIILRAFFNTSTMLADEYSGYLYLAIVCFGLGYTFLRDGHIRITFMTAKLSNKASSFVDVFAGVMTLGVLIFALYRTVLLAYDAYVFEVRSEAVSATPIYLTQLALPLGLCLFIVAVVAYILERLFHDQ